MDEHESENRLFIAKARWPATKKNQNTNDKFYSLESMAFLNSSTKSNVNDNDDDLAIDILFGN